MGSTLKGMKTKKSTQKNLGKQKLQYKEKFTGFYTEVNRANAKSLPPVFCKLNPLQTDWQYLPRGHKQFISNEPYI